MKTLLVIVPDRISEILAKGEYQPRYYNPGEVFDAVHILMTNDDRPDPAALRHTVGRAELHLHNLPEDRWHFLERTPFFRPFFMRPGARLLRQALVRLQLWLWARWARPAVKLAERIRPALVRVHGSDMPMIVARAIRSALGIPYVVSLHINPDVNPLRRSVDPEASVLRRLHAVLFEAMERESLQRADLVMPVYKPILPYVERMGAPRCEVCYNILDGKTLRRKKDYALHKPVRLISVGRHFALKNPENLLRAVADLPGTRITLVGHGAYQDRLEALAAELGLGDRAVFRPSVPNAELCALLAEQDIFVVHTEHWEISKSVLEALLTGLPVVINKRQGEPVPEFVESGVVDLVENTPEGYGDALRRLIEDDAYRERRGREAYAYAQDHWAPSKTEAKVAGIYRRVMREPVS